MTKRSIRFAAGTAAALTLLGGGVAIAAIPSTATTGQITACVHQSTAAVRIIDAQAGKTCNGDETTLNWSKGLELQGRVAGQRQLRRR